MTSEAQENTARSLFVHAAALVEMRRRLEHTLSHGRQSSVERQQQAEVVLSTAWGTEHEDDVAPAYQDVMVGEALEAQ